MIKLNSNKGKAQALMTLEKYEAERRNPANYITAKDFIAIDRAQGIVAPDLHVLRKQMIGTFRNADVVLG